MTASEILVKDILQTTGNPELERAMAQTHTTTWWLLNDIAVIDRARLNEAHAAISA